MTGPQEAILCVTIKWHFLAVRTVESSHMTLYHVENNFKFLWTVTWKSLPWKKKKKILKNGVSGPIILNVNWSLGNKKEKKSKEKRLLVFLTSVSLISSPFQLPKGSYLLSDWHLGRMLLAQTFANSRWQKKTNTGFFRGFSWGPFSDFSVT